MPKYVLDVTIPIRFLMERDYLRLGKGRKSDLIGMFNPVPESLAQPVHLCIVYKQD